MPTEPQHDPDRGMGEVFTRVARVRASLGEPVYARAVKALLLTLGAIALEEAERRAKSLAGGGPDRTNRAASQARDRFPPRNPTD